MTEKNNSNTSYAKRVLFFPCVNDRSIREIMPNNVWILIIFSPNQTMSSIEHGNQKVTVAQFMYPPPHPPSWEG